MLMNGSSLMSESYHSDLVTVETASLASTGTSPAQTSCGEAVQSASGWSAKDGGSVLICCVIM